MFYSVLSAIYQIIKFGKCYPSQNSHYKQFHRNHGTEREREKESFQTSIITPSESVNIQFCRRCCFLFAKSLLPFMTLVREHDTR